MRERVFALRRLPDGVADPQEQLYKQLALGKPKLEVIGGVCHVGEISVAA